MAKAAFATKLTAAWLLYTSPLTFQPLSSIKTLLQVRLITSVAEEDSPFISSLWSFLGMLPSLCIGTYHHP
jgi:hypothetical protein